MRCVILLLIIGTTFPAAAFGQALDIGGIEIRLGQDASTTLRALASYRVAYNQGMRSWFVSQQVGERVEWLGHFRADDGKVTFISKGYPLSDPDDTPRVFSHALRDVRRRGGPACVTRTVEWTDDMVHEIETRCGKYRLTYSFPFKSDDGPVAAGVSITLGIMPPR